MAKKLMSLGGNYYQMTAVKAAKRLGCYVIDVDYLPDNPAHKYADEYYNISTLEREEVLALARQKKIDGIISYASDVSAPTAAYVAEQMGLPTNPLKSVEIMTRKDLFHPFLKKHGFFTPCTMQVNKVEDVVDFFEQIDGPIMLKPCSSSGSKGITRIDDKEQIQKAYKEAQKYSQGGVLVVEEFLQREYYQIAGDAFVVNGKIAYFGLANEHFDRLCNPLVPIGESFPADIGQNQREMARKEIQRALNLLEIKNGAINLDFMFDKKGNVFIIELGPRNGGNLITDAICLAGDVDLAEYTVKAALGEDLSGLKEEPMSRYIASYIYHVLEDGIYEDIFISEKLRGKLRRSEMFVKRGEPVYRFENGGFGIGAALIEFESIEEMLYMMDHMEEYYKIIYKK